jgi:hypothetical protein
MKDLLNRALPNGIELLSMQDITREKERPKIKESHYNISLNRIDIDMDDLKKFLDADHYPMTIQRKRGEKTIDVKTLVKTMDVVPPDEIRLTLRHPSGPSLKPVEVIKAVFHLDDEKIKEINILKYGQVMG